MHELRNHDALVDYAFNAGRAQASREQAREIRRIWNALTAAVRTALQRRHASACGGPAGAH